MNAKLKSAKRRLPRTSASFTTAVTNFSRSEHMQSHQIAALLEWCGQNEIWVDPRIRLHHDIQTGIGVFASDVIQNSSTGVRSSYCYFLIHAGLISCGSKVAKIPKDQVLSSRSCSFSDVLENFVNHKGHDATLVLSLAVCLEMSVPKFATCHILLKFSQAIRSFFQVVGLPWFFARARRYCFILGSRR